MGRLVGRKGKADRFGGDLNTTHVKKLQTGERPLAKNFLIIWKFFGCALCRTLRLRLNAPSFYALLVLVE